MTTAEELEREIIFAHNCADANTLAQLYARAADLHEGSGETDAACFYLTHAFVFALESGDDSADKLLERLRSHGREE